MTNEKLAAILAALDGIKAEQTAEEDIIGQRQVWRERLAEGKPALTEDDFPRQAAARLTVGVVAACEGKSLPLAAAEALVVSYLADAPTAADWQSHGILPRQGDLYLHLACQRALADKAQEVAAAIATDEWAEQFCPVCGASPAYAVLTGEGGRRMLVCGACLTQWRYKRLGCVFCQEQRPEQLKYLSSEEFPGWSAAVCLSCRGYIKTADLRHLKGAPVWPVAALTTLPLDYATTKWLESPEAPAN